MHKGLASHGGPRGRSHRQGGWELACQGAGCDGFWDEYWYVVVVVVAFLRMRERVSGFGWVMLTGFLGVDFDAANAVVEATHRHKAIFYDGE
jgi:hypothetical protein